MGNRHISEYTPKGVAVPWVKMLPSSGNMYYRVASDRFSIKKDENLDRTLIPHSQVRGQVELGLLDENQLEYKDEHITHLNSVTVKKNSNHIKFHH